MSKHRVPAGVPTGGQFAAMSHTEAEVELPGPVEDEREPMLVLTDEGDEWVLDGKLHRVDGPAVETEDGIREWWQHGELHRTGGPAVEIYLPSGEKADYFEYWERGERHRVDGPAVQDEDGEQEWYLRDRRVTVEEHTEFSTLPDTDQDLVLRMWSDWSGTFTDLIETVRACTTNN